MKLLCLLSEGIESSVAAHVMRQKRHDVRCIHFRTDKVKAVKEIAKKLDFKLKIKRYIPKLRFVSVSVLGANKDARTLRKATNHAERKRAMLASAAKYAKKIGADALLTGETISSARTARSVGVNIPVVRPLVGFNQSEIEVVAKKLRL